MTQEQHTLQRMSLKQPLVLGNESLSKYLMRFKANPDERHAFRTSSIFDEAPSDVRTRLLMSACDFGKRSPYDDKNDALDRLAQRVLQDLGDAGPEGIIERIMDRVRPVDGTILETAFPRHHRFLDQEFTMDITRLTSDELPYAGSLLEDDRRQYHDDRFAMVHPMEPYMLAVALLRQQGFEAYPGRVYMGEGEEDPISPIIAIFDFEGTELTTFRFLRAHPDIVHIDLMSDTAVMGALHAMRAIARANHLAAENVIRELEGHSLSQDEIKHQLDRIADDLLGYCVNWSEEGLEKNQLLLQSFDGIRSHIVQAEAWLRLRGILKGMPTGNSRADLFLSSRGVTKDAPEIAINPQHLGMFLDMNEAVLEHYPPLVSAVMDQWRRASATAMDVDATLRSMVDGRLEKKIAETESPHC